MSSAQPPANEEEAKKEKKQKRNGQPEVAMANDGVELRNLGGVTSINITMKAAPLDPQGVPPPTNRSSASAYAGAGFDAGIAVATGANGMAVSSVPRRRSSSAKCTNRNDIGRAAENVGGPMCAINISRSYGTIREEGSCQQPRAVKSNNSKPSLQVVSTETIARRQCIYNVEQEQPKPRPTSPSTFLQGVVQSAPGRCSVNALCQAVPAQQAPPQVSPVYMGPPSAGYRAPSMPQQQIAATLSGSKAGETVSVCCRSNTQLGNPMNIPQYEQPRQASLPQQRQIEATLSESKAGQTVSVCCRSNTQLNRSPINPAQYGQLSQPTLPPQQQVAATLAGSRTGQTIAVCCRSNTQVNANPTNIAQYEQPSAPQQRQVGAALSQSNAGQAVSVCCRSNTQLNRGSTNLAQCEQPSQPTYQPQPARPPQSTAGYQAQAYQACPAGGYQASIATGIQAPQPLSALNQNAALQPQFQGQGVTTNQEVTATGYPAPPQPCSMDPTCQAEARVINCQGGYQRAQQPYAMDPRSQAAGVTAAGYLNQPVQGYAAAAPGQPVIPVSQRSPLSVQMASYEPRDVSQPASLVQQQTMYQQQQCVPDSGAMYQQRTIGYHRSLELIDGQDQNRNYVAPTQPQPASTSIVLGIELRKSSKHDASSKSKKKEANPSSGGK
ncbi:uncharacterized protein LOC135385284 [Ornithodoros turicata]|uniref:uncharacterized protein LOC135385284 n=1 Tax=Ornithodoros turicata TaxID=34597 RepID=UPI00313A3D93